MIGSHTGENLSSELKETFDKYGLKEKIVSVSADNAFNIQNGLELLKE